MTHTTKKRMLLGVLIAAAAVALQASGWLSSEPALALTTSTPPSSDAALSLQPNSRLWISGTSNVKKFECKAPTIDVTVATTQDGAVRAVNAGDKAVGAVAITVPAETLDCDNGTMNEHMRKALKATEHPVISFTLESYTLVKAADTVAITLNGLLTMGGTAKAVTIDAQAIAGVADVLHVTGLYEVHMKEFGLKPPSLMLGTMKVNEKVQVHFDLLLKS